MQRSDVRIIRNGRIPMRDGVRLAATLYLPKAEDVYPALLEYLPYRKDDMGWTSEGPHHYFATRSYAVVRVDVRGTGSSEGISTGEYSPVEQLDAADVIAWIAKQPWCTGAVGMFGTSYGGFTSLQAAMNDTPQLKAIVSMYASDDRYTDDCHYAGGCLRDYDVGRYGNRMLGWNALPPDPEVVGGDWESLWRRRLAEGEPWLLQWLKNQVDGPYWRSGSVRPDYSRVHCPVFAIGGFRDGYVNAPLRLLRHCRVPVKVLIGPWTHQQPHRAQPGPRIDWLREALRWWDHWLKGVETGILAEPPVTIYVQGYDPPATIRDVTTGYWRTAATWPPPDAQEISFRAIGEGRLATPPAGTVARDAAEAWDTIPAARHIGLAGGVFSAGGVPFGLPLDQRSDEGHSLTYTSAPLEHSLEVAGNPQLALRVEVDDSEAVLVAKLCDVAPDGASALVTRGILNLTHHASHAHPEPLKAGRTYALALELDCTAWRFHTGHRVRLDLAMADWPTVWPSAATRPLRVHRSSLQLRSITLPQAQPALSPFADPPELPSLTDVHSGPTEYTVIHDFLDQRTTVRNRIEREFALPSGTAVREWREMESTLAPHGPALAASTGRGAITLRWADAHIEIRTYTGVVAHPTALETTLTLDVDRNGKEFFRKRWEEQIPRRG